MLRTHICLLRLCTTGNFLDTAAYETGSGADERSAIESFQKQMSAQPNTHSGRYSYLDGTNLTSRFAMLEQVTSSKQAHGSRPLLTYYLHVLRFVPKARLDLLGRLLNGLDDIDDQELRVSTAQAILASDTFVSGMQNFCDSSLGLW